MFSFVMGRPSRRMFALLCLTLLVIVPAFARKHTIALGQTLPVKWFVGPTEDKMVTLKVRGLYVDGRLKDFTIGEPHDITDRLFVVRRMFRLNDQLPADAKVPRWRWQRGGWLLVDRDSGRVSAVKLPDFDPFYSVVSWYRDYAAYCGISGDGEKVLAVVAQIGDKKPLVRKEVGAASQSNQPDSECPAPEWQRQPARVTFLPRTGQRLSFAVNGRIAGIASEPEPSEPESKSQ